MCLHCSTLSVHDEVVRRIKKLHHPIQGNRHHRGGHSGRIDLVEQHHRAIAVNLHPHFFEEVQVFAVIVGDLLQRHAHLLERLWRSRSGRAARSSAVLSGRKSPLNKPKPFVTEVTALASTRIVILCPALTAAHATLGTAQIWASSSASAVFI